VSGIGAEPASGASLADLAALGLRIANLGASANLHIPDQAERKEQGLDEAKRFIDLARQLKSPCVASTVFGRSKNGSG